MTIQFADDGTIIIDWADDREQGPLGGVSHTTWITLDGRAANEHVDYYAKELRGDAEELLGYFEKARRGLT